MGGDRASSYGRQSSTYTSWSKVLGRRSPGLGRTRHRPPEGGRYVIAESSAESLSRKIGSVSSDRSSAIVRAAVRRREARTICRKGGLAMRGEQGDENAGRASGVSLAWARGMKKTTSRSKSTTPGSDSKRSVLAKVTLTAGACLLIVFTIIGMGLTLHGSDLTALQGGGS